MNKLTQLELAAVLALLGLGGFMAWRLYKGVGDIKDHATDSNGRPVTAYKDAGPLGTLAAAANAASGGYLATFGDWLGGAVYDVMHPAPDPAATPLPTVASSTERDAASAAATAAWMYPAGTFSDGAGLAGDAFPTYP